MKLIVIKDIEVQNANTVAGFTYGSIGATPILGFTEALNRKSQQHPDFCEVKLKGCAIITHDYHLHTFKNDNGAIKFTQSRNSPYLYGLTDDKKSATASIIEEGKMNIKLSLIIAYEGNIYNDKYFTNWLKNQCYLQRISGGTILNIKQINLFGIEDIEQDKIKLKGLVRSLLPGFVLYERSDLLSDYTNNHQKETLPAWIDFISLKQIARPAYHLISQHLEKQAQSDENNELLQLWQAYLQESYQNTQVPIAIKSYFAALGNHKKNKELLSQWQNYLEPTAKTDAEWQYIAKPAKGYLVPMMCGYKAISQVYQNQDVENTRDAITEVCFVEAVHTIGEWRSVHRIKALKDLQDAIWCYSDEPNWYLCKQNYQPSTSETDSQDNPY